MLYPSMTPSRFVSDLSGIWDFATSQSLLRVQGNKKGIFTRDRKPKLAAHYFRERTPINSLLIDLWSISSQKMLGRSLAFSVMHGKLSTNPTKHVGQ